MCVEHIDIPLRCDIVVYCEFTNKVGGIPTFIYNFCQNMKEYSIVFVYDSMDDLQINRLMKIVPVVKSDRKIVCNTVIVNRLTDNIPSNIIYKQSVQICHACKQIKLTIPQDRDILVNVSNVAKESWGEVSKKGIVIHNMPWNENKLLLVSATRIGAKDKGSNDVRMKLLAERLNDAKVPYVWLNIADKPLLGMPSNFINVPAMIDTQTIISRADYLVQLSDVEAYSMSVLEALSNNVPVLCTPFPSAKEEGVIDGVTGYFIPFNMEYDYKKILNVPKFVYKPETEQIKKQWKQILGESEVPSDNVMLKVKNEYFDVQVKMDFKEGRVFVTDRNRAESLIQKDLCEEVK